MDTGVGSSSSTGESQGGASGESSSGLDASCEAFSNTTSEPVAVEITIVNTTDEPVYWPLICADIPFTIVDPDGNALAWIADGWTPTCEELMSSEVSCGGPGCSSAVRRLDPSGSVTYSWPGTVRTPTPMPERCVAPENLDGGCWFGTTCPVESNALEAGYTAQVEVWSQASCLGDPCEPCEADATGTCSTGVGPDEWFVEGEPTVVAVAFEHPETTSLTVQIGG